jgi:hypothetical protein
MDTPCPRVNIKMGTLDCSVALQMGAQVVVMNKDILIFLNIGLRRVHSERGAKEKE